MTSESTYFMENPQEAVRLDRKTDPEAVRKQATWCGVRAGLRVLDAGCGPGKVTSILHEMVQPGGTVVGVDYSPERIQYARDHYGKMRGIDFQVHDLRQSPGGLDRFDLVWARFMLEYNCSEAFDIVRNLTACLRPGGILCLLDLDHNCLSHYELPPGMQEILQELAARVQATHNFDPYAGRKLYRHLYDSGYQDIRVDLVPHHLIYGEVKDLEVFNWVKKSEIVSLKARGMFEKYPGGHDAFFQDFSNFFLSPRRFTYTPLILCKGTKPSS
ncbi:MAG: methyltransferase domain-containing protein [Thermodesulfobacteriota bacterium]